ncbi:hypothetical protein EZ449_08165 [Pedobacter frigidisoli]|uniref:Outer membrane protein beta-barrel domain-containing protein n=1 Tax=Pedobacter frigidisoli TaxID=2530455 RepID=A0A4R0P4Z5_9SPHI|nr:outer membrane beta-barrel protein [Pedobacter frigidisoli]TCD10844.1 hypothetical protein EZ449_08165 [Pedobacter frigidisoli]
MKEGKDIDKFFKDGLDNPDIPFNDLDWENLEDKMYPKVKRRIVPLIWLSAIAGIAAMLLIVFLWVKPGSNESKNTVIVNKTKGNKAGEGKKKLDANTQLSNQSPLVATNPQAIENVYPNDNLPNQNEYLKIGSVKETSSTSTLDSVNSNMLANLNPPKTISALRYHAAEYKNNNAVKDLTLPKIDKNAIAVIKSKPRIVLSLSAAPDLTSVQKSGRSSLSGGLGIEATIFLTKKLSISTGAAYAKKIYDADFSLYNPNSSYFFKTIPTNIHANCDVLDIPLNVNYNILKSNRNSITLSTGLSTYLMLKEDYYYSYASSYGAGRDSYEVKNQNQHILGIANIGIEFQRKINNKLSISARPFMKIPLTNIGYGNSKLSSTGIAISVNMDLFKR